jgi:hypothetical protein
LRLAFGQSRSPAESLSTLPREAEAIWVAQNRGFKPDGTGGIVVELWDNPDIAFTFPNAVLRPSEGGRFKVTADFSSQTIAGQTYRSTFDAEITSDSWKGTHTLVRTAGGPPCTETYDEEGSRQ